MAKGKTKNDGVPPSQRVNHRVPRELVVGCRRAWSRGVFLQVWAPGWDRTIGPWYVTAGRFVKKKTLKRRNKILQLVVVSGSALRPLCGFRKRLDQKRFDWIHTPRRTIVSSNIRHSDHLAQVLTDTWTSRFCNKNKICLKIAACGHCQLLSTWIC